jgi:hypothetical protein
MAMDTMRIGPGESLLVQPKGGDGLLQVKAGDVVRARVVKNLGGGELSLRIGGTLVQARSPEPLPMGAGVLFRVLGREGGGLKLQFLEMVEDVQGSPAGRAAAPAPGNLPGAVSGGGRSMETIRSLISDLAALSSSGSGRVGDLSGTVRQLLKSLPDDPSSLPGDLRHQLLGLLQSTLRAAEQSIQKRALLILGDPSLQEGLELQGQPSAQLETAHRSLARLPLFAEIEKILQTSLKSLLQDTGVGLETKLKALARSLLSGEHRELDADGQTVPHGWPQLEPGFLGSDLKARLLRLRQWILDGGAVEPGPGEDAWASAGTKTGEAGKGAEKMLPLVDGLLQDIETFQLLSRLTSSFCTFLPLLWSGLREGDIAFKRGRAGGKAHIHYCVVNLDFETLGRLVVVAMMQGGELFLSFKADHGELRRVLDEHLPELHEMFRSEGLSLAGVSVLAMDDARLAPFESLESIESILNLKV